MKDERSTRLLDSHFHIFGTMDGFSLVKWAVKIKNSLNADISCRLFVCFLDKRGGRINASGKWKWFPDPYSQKRYLHMDQGLTYCLKKNRVKEISGTVKTTAQEASRFEYIDFRVERVICWLGVLLV